MAHENRFDTMFKTSFENIKGMLDSNTVVGNAIELSNGTSIIPISKLSVGFATGGLDSAATPQKSNKFGGGGGSGEQRPGRRQLTTANCSSHFSSTHSFPSRQKRLKVVISR